MSELEPDLDLDEQSDLDVEESPEEEVDAEEPQEEDFEIAEEELEEESAQDSDEQVEEEPEPEPEPEPEGPLELKIIETHQWNNESLVLKSSVQENDPGYFLIRVIAESLQLSEKLIRIEVNHELACWNEYSMQVTEDELPFCSINDYVIESYQEELLHEFYDQLNGRSITQANLLNLWMRAWSPDCTDLFELIQKSHSLAVLASLVERGANPLAAIKLK